MRRIQACCHLHRLHLVDGLAGRIERTAQVEWGTPVGVVVLDDQILHFLRVDKGSRKRVLLRLNVVVVLEAVSSQQFLDLLVRTWRNLVNHRPGEGNLGLVLQIVKESLWNQSILHPTLSIGKDSGLHLVAVVRAVVHRLNGERQFPCLKPL